MNNAFATLFLVNVIGLGAAWCRAEQFTDVASMVAISREDQAKLLAIHALKKEVTLQDAI